MDSLLQLTSYEGKIALNRLVSQTWITIRIHDGLQRNQALLAASVNMLLL